MKNTFKLFGIFALAAVIGFTMTACSTEDDDSKTLDRITVTPPTKTQYNFGEDLVLTGMVITASYSDGSTTAVAVNDTTISGYNKKIAGNQTVTVTWKGKTGSFTVNVGDPVNITIAAINGVTAPATGATPVTTITANNQYTGTVTWSPNHPTFAASTPYTATITLTAKDGYTLNGVTRNFFTVTGATATNDANSGVITAVFPQASEMLTVTNVTEWNNACNRIAVGGNGTSSAPKAYVIMVSGNIAVPVVSQTFGSVSYVVVTLQGNGTLSSNSQGNMIKTTSDQTLIIDSPNLTLQGPTNNNSPFIYCAGKLEMKNGTISGNVDVNTQVSSAIINGGVVYANDFTMSGGSISGGSSVYSLYLGYSGIGQALSYGGGVYVNGNFTMSGGTISGSSSAANGYTNVSEGGGVYVRGNFTMSGGTISGSSSNCTNSDAQKYESSVSGYIANVHSYGGGVYAKGAFIKTGGVIYGNDAPDTNKNTVSGPNTCGHAVYLGSGYYRDGTLYESDNLSSVSPLPVGSGQTLNGWTKQ